VKNPSVWVACVAVLMLPASSPWAQERGSWIGTWETSATGLPTISKLGPYPVPPPRTLQGSIRYRLRISGGGSAIRLRFSNEYGDEPLVMGAVSVGLAAHGLDAISGSLKRVTFSGSPAVSIPAGAPGLSDPIYMRVEALSDLIVTVYFPQGVRAAVSTADGVPIAPAFVEKTNATLMEHLTRTKTIGARPVMSAVSVFTVGRRKVVVALGDSITDGVVDVLTGERGWPDVLSRRLRGDDTSVINAGIGGNRLLQSMDFMGKSALSRLDQDVFSVPGLSHLVVLEGINDIGLSGRRSILGSDSPLVQPQELIAAYRQIVARAHERGVKVFGATILPFEGAFAGETYYSTEKEKIRQLVNHWIRTSGEFDGTIDFDAALRDPDHPGRLHVEYDSGDHLHPSSAGYRRMGDFVDLRLFNGD
jgi:lysophospholipase L1-like esterase